MIEKTLSNFKRKLTQQDLSLVTIQGYLNDTRHFLHWVESSYDREVELKNVTYGDIQAYRQELLVIKRQKAASINRRIQTIKRFCDWASQARLIKDNPAHKIRFIKKPRNTTPTILTKNEVHKLVRTARVSSHGLAKRNHAIIQLILQAGLRVSEVAKLRYEDIIIGDRSGTVRIIDGKGLKEREVPLNNSIRTSLSEYFTSRGELTSKDPVFMSKRGKSPTIRSIQSMVSSIAKKAEIDRIKVTAHILRHTFAVRYLEANPGCLTELAILLGHESLNTTAIYTKPSKDKLATNIEQSEINIYGE